MIENSNAELVLLNKPAKTGGSAQRMHSKYLLFDGPYRLNDEIGCHQIVWAGALNYTTAALTRNNETLSRVVDPGVHRTLLRNWHELRYTNQLGRTDAALPHGGNGKIYFFGGRHYVRWNPETGIETIDTNVALRRIGSHGWQGLSGSFSRNLDAALWYPANNHVYLFKGSHYVKWKPDHGVVGISRRIGEDGWEGLPGPLRSNLDAVIAHPTNDHIYFFKRSQYCKWKPGEGPVSPALREIGADGWQLPGPILSGGIDTAFSHPSNGHVYFVSGDSYCKWKPGSGIVEPAVRVLGEYGWEGLRF